MAMLVVLLESDEGELLLGSRAMNGLARLGVSSVALLADERTTCVVLEGWAFDAARSACDAVAAISRTSRSVRVLSSVMHTFVQLG
jgi:hypothetical protein